MKKILAIALVLLFIAGFVYADYTKVKYNPVEIATGTGTLTDGRVCTYDSAGNEIDCSTVTSANLAATLSDETGTGVAVFGTAPTFTTNITSPILNFGSASGLTTGYLTSTSHATKGSYSLNSAGTIVVDEANVRIGIGTTPTYEFDITKAKTGGVIGHIKNSSAGTGNYGQMLIKADTAILYLHALSSTYSSSGTEVANGAAVTTDGVGGLSVGAANASGVLRFYTGGTTEQWRIGATGLLSSSVAGNGLGIKEGTNATMGTATLVAGTATVSTTKVTASSRIFLTPQSLGTVTVPWAVGVTARTAATSFTITSATDTDTSVVAWIIMEPS